jgi:hypothetical protein
MYSMKYPVLHSQMHFYQGGIEKPLDWANLELLENEWFEGFRAIDSDGQEWLVTGYKVFGYKNILQYFKLRKFRNVKVSYIYEKGKLYDIESLKQELEGFIMNNRIKGSPFENKKRDVPKFLEQFSNIQSLVGSNAIFFDK